MDNNKDFEQLIAEIEATTRKEITGKTPTMQDKADVFNEFHRPFYETLRKELTSVEKFYDEITSHYFMTVGMDNISVHTFFDLNKVEHLDTNLLSSKDKNVMENARSIMFHLSFQHIKAGYRLRDISIFLYYSVIFEDNYYTFNENTYAYGEYPSPKDISKAIDAAKKKCIETLQKAIKA